jgi:hypothetical protein
MTAHRAMLQRPAIDDNLTRLISRSLKCGGQRHLITRPGHVEVRYVLDTERNPDEYVGTLQSDSVDGVMHGLDEEVSLAGGVRWLSAAHGQGVWKCQRSAQSSVVTVTTMTGHVSTVIVFDCSARLRSLLSNGSLRSLRAERDPDTVAGCGALPTIEPARGVPSGR